MKRIIIVIGVLILTSCATAFQQITTISSPQMNVTTDGRYVYSENDVDVDVEYDFWAQNGRVKFVITNNTEFDIYVDLARSFFVVNGMAFDYYQNRTYSTHSSSTLVSSYTYGGSNTFARSTGLANAFSSAFGDYINTDEYSIVAGTRRSNSYSHRTTATSTVNRGLQYQEKEGVWIPPHSSKSFSEFSLLETPYRKCGFARDPKKNENVTLKFNEETSPYVFDNILTILINRQEHRIVNSFYVESISNYQIQDTYDEIFDRYCDGSPSMNKLRVYKFRAANKFYINYNYFPSGTEMGGNDRLKNESSRYRFSHR